MLEDAHKVVTALTTPPSDVEGLVGRLEAGYRSSGPKGNAVMLVRVGAIVLTPISLLLFAITGGGALLGYRWR